MEFNAKQIIIIVVSIVLFGIIIYFVAKTFAQQCPDGQTFDKSMNKCRKACSSGTTYYPEVNDCLPCNLNQDLIDGQCYDRCDLTKEIRCGTKCYDKLTYDCVNNIDCMKIKHCGVDTCCPDDKYCIQGKCADCPIPCGKPPCCTKPGETCYADKCCDPSKQGYDSTGKVEKCCDTDLCGPNKICCDSNGGELCYNGECVIGCPNTSNMNLYKCGDKVPTFSGTPQACKNEGEECVHDCDKDSYFCAADPCQWENPLYTPNFLVDDNGQQVLYNGKVISQCTDSSSPVNYYIKSTNGLVPSTIEIKGINSPQCDIEKCIDKIQSHDVNIINYDFDKDNTTMLEGTCTGVVSCDKALLDDEGVTSVCTTLEGRCCIDSKNNYTGQVCPAHNKCWEVNGDYTCSPTDPLCLPDGTKFLIEYDNYDSSSVQKKNQNVLKTKYVEDYKKNGYSPNCKDVWQKYDATKTLNQQMDHMCCTGNYYTMVETDTTSNGAKLWGVCGLPEKTPRCQSSTDCAQLTTGCPSDFPLRNYQSCMSNYCADAPFSSSDSVSLQTGLPFGEFGLIANPEVIPIPPVPSNPTTSPKPTTKPSKTSSNNTFIIISIVLIIIAIISLYLLRNKL